MIGSKKKIVVVLAAGVLLGGAAVMRSRQSQSAGTGPYGSRPAAGSLFTNDPNLFSREAYQSGTGELMFKMMFSVLLVIGLGAAAAYAFKKYMPRITNAAGREIRVLETAHLGPRKTVHLLKVGGQRLLVGSTNENITLLADVTEALSETDSQAPASSMEVLQQRL